MLDGGDLPPPEGGDEKDEEGEAFEAAQEHDEGADEFGGCGEVGIAAKPAADAESRAVACDAGDGGANGFGGVDATEHEHHDSGKDDHDVHHEYHHDVGEEVRRDRGAVEAHGVDGMRVEPVAQYLAHVADEDEHAHGFETAGGGAGHTAAEGENDKEIGDGDPPVGGVGHQGAGGGKHAGSLHDA